MTCSSRSIDQHTQETALRACGWAAVSGQQFALAVDGAQPATLTLRHERGDWRYFQLHGGKLLASENGSVLADNATLFGPAKLVASSSGVPTYRVDVPHDIESLGLDRFEVGDVGVMGDPHLAWSTALTTLVTGIGERSARDTNAEDVVASIKKCGWSATVDEGQVAVHLQLPEIFRQVRLEAGSSGVKLTTDLIELAGYTEESRCAVTHFANVVNARLPLVRLACYRHSQQPSVLRAEVHFGCVLIPGAWLSTALQVVETTVALTARELEALRDPELAKLVLAAASA